MQMCRLDSRLYPACLRTTNVTIERSRTNLQFVQRKLWMVCVEHKSAVCAISLKKV